MKRYILIFCVLIIGFVYGAACAGVNEELSAALCWGTTIEKVRQLLSKGADVNAKDADGNTPLYNAASSVASPEEIVKLLLDKGAEVNAKSNYERTPLYAAASRVDKALEIVKLLVEKGADVKAKNHLGQTPLQEACRHNTDAAIFLVEKGADVNAAVFNGETWLLVAAKYGTMDLVRFLIEKGANVKATWNGESVLHIVAEAGKADMAKLLIEKGADVNAKGDDGSTPLHKAAMAGNTEMVMFFIENGAEVNVINKNGETPLVSAEKAGKIDVAEILHTHGAGARSGEALDQLLKEMLTSYGVSFDKPKREKILELVRAVSPPPAIPAEAEKHMNRGLAAFKMAQNKKDYEEARAEFQQAANLAPWWADPYCNLGLVWDKLKDSELRAYEYALDNLQFYLKVKPDAPDAAVVRQKIDEIEYLHERKLKADEYINRGSELFNSGDFQGCVLENKEAIRLYPEYSHAHTNLGSAYVKLERYQEAIPELKEAIRLGERVPYVYSNLGFSYKNLGDLKNAISILEEGVRASSLLYNKGELLQRLGRYYNENGQYEKALEQFLKALKLADQHEPFDNTGNEKDIDKKYLQEMINKLNSRLGK